MPTTEELNDMTALMLGIDDATFEQQTSSEARAQIIALAIAAKQAEATKMVAYATVYGQFPEGYDA